ncbi:unnamed protein product [Musa acuminata subsp. malaccensis]|uniref:(wild Malaysian banana) hypothetical protein n=1 Tax=Musa acuminata subsp. malaccensis TaxID=214687 RepID=A0A804JWA7_MUSAM|nr:unnamed protein product [Musa acuminata subsp. malaccensis]
MINDIIGDLFKLGFGPYVTIADWFKWLPVPFLLSDAIQTWLANWYRRCFICCYCLISSALDLCGRKVNLSSLMPIYTLLYISHPLRPTFPGSHHLVLHG